MSGLLDGIKVVAFDLDGTIYFGERLAEGVNRILAILRERKIDVFFFTNNSGKSRDQIKNKLTKLGLEADQGKVYSSGYAAAIYANSQNFKKVFCCSSEDLKNQFREIGIS